MRTFLPLRDAMRVPMRSTVISVALEAVVALAQGALAVVLGALARYLGSGSGHALGAAGMTRMSRVSWMLPAKLATLVVTMGATGVAVAGLFAVAVRGGAHIVLEARETRDAAMLSAVARRRILSAALLGARSPKTSMGAAVTWPTEIERALRAERARIRALVHLAVLAAVVAALDAPLAALLIALLAPFGLLLRPVRRRLRRVHASASRGAIETVDASRDLLEHAALWASCGGGAVVTRRVEALSTEGAELAADAARARSTASLLNELLAALAIVLLVAVFASSARPSLVAVLIVLVSAYRPIRDIAESSPLVERGVSAWGEIAAFGNAADAGVPPTRTWRPDRLVAHALAVDVGGARARAGIDLELGPGDIVAIVGAPGSGKSALLEVLAGARAGRGAVHYGPVCLDGAGIGPALRPIAWVPPSPPSLPGTLAENLAPDASEDRGRIARARAILRALGDATIVSLPDEARLGPRGRVLSSGESQRIALARALASDAPVLLLDEPTANLDADGELRAIEVLRDAARERSIVLVTHRTAPLSLADRVIDLSSPDASRSAERSSESVVRAAESERRIA